MIDYNQEQQQTMALAGICSAVLLVQQISQKGKCDTALFDMLTHSVLSTNPDTTLDVYQSLTLLTPGLEILVQQLDNSSKRKDVELTRYIISLLALEKHLRKKPDMLQIIANRIEHIQKHNQFHTADSNNSITAGLAGIYLDTISTLPFRVQVTGNPMYLKMSANQDKVRAILLAGIRSVILWRQLGGSRWQILFKRKRIIASANGLLSI